MRSDSEHDNADMLQDYREIRVLTEVEKQPDVSQRELSHRVGIALGLTNVLLRNLVQKGYVKVAQADWKRRLYTLTPDGFSRRIRLTASYVYRVLDHYRWVRRTLRKELESYALNAESRVAVCGTGEFAELVYLGLRDIGIEEIDFFEVDAATEDSLQFLGTPVNRLSCLRPKDYDRVIIAVLDQRNKTWDQLEKIGAKSENIVTFFKLTNGEEDSGQ